jgi:hypothetical protein
MAASLKVLRIFHGVMVNVDFADPSFRRLFVALQYNWFLWNRLVARELAPE